MLLLRLGLVIAVGACGPRVAHPAPASEAASFAVDREALLRAGASADLVTKLAASRMHYFRMLAEPFEVRTCNAFSDDAPMLPIIAVQGDAHVEQFVVTEATYGLEDFDRAGFGPAVVDLVRYGASLHVACSDVTWPCDPEAAIETFLTAYRASLIAEPATQEPALVQRLRTKAPRSRASWVAWADTLMVPLPPAIEADTRRSWYAFAAQMREIDPMWTEATTTIVGLGALHLGFGSALERKVLIRIAGATAGPEDDVIVEAREGVAPSSRGCVWRGSYGESMVLLFTAVLGRRMPTLHGFAPLLGSTRHFWLQSWDPGYAELSLADITSQHELEELAADAARQLAGQLWSRFPETLGRYQRHAQRKAFDATRARVITLARELATEANAAWERFRANP